MILLSELLLCGAVARISNPRRPILRTALARVEIHRACCANGTPARGTWRRDSTSRSETESMMATLGVLGGMGPSATLDFLNRIIEATASERDQDHIHVLVDSNPQVPDRTAFLRSQGPDPRPVLIEMARGLQHAGADLLVMPCNTAHAFAEDIRSSVSIPLVDWPCIVADAIAAGGVNQVGILASLGTIEARIYQDVLGVRSILPLIPAEPYLSRMMNSIYGPSGVKAAGPKSSIARDDLLAVGESMIARGADGLILACTEFSAIHGSERLEMSVPVFDASDIVARHVVDLIWTGKDVSAMTSQGVA